MGTSTGYGMPTGGEWTPLKTGVTKFAKSGESESLTPNALLGKYLKAIGGVNDIYQGGRGGGGGTVQKAGRNLSSFLSRVGSVGLNDALREIGLSNLIGRSAVEVSAGLLDSLMGSASTLDEAAARAALADINEDLLQDAQTYEDVERVLSESLDKDGLAKILARFFGYYIYERFCRDFYERLIKAVGSLQANNLLKSIKGCIESSLKAKTVNRDLTKIDWKGTEGQRLTEQILLETIEIFEI